MAERPEGGGFRRPPPDEAWPAPGDTGRIQPPPAGAAPRPVPGPAPAAVPVPYQPLPPLPPMVPPPAPAGFGFRPQTEPSAVLALVLSISAWLVCPVFAAIAALLIAGGAKAKIDVAGGALTGDGLVSAARWIAWIHIFMMSVGTLALIIGYNLFGTLLK